MTRRRARGRLGIVAPCGLIFVLIGLDGRAAVPPSALRGIAIDRPLEAEPLPTDVPRTLPLVIRLAVDEAAFTGSSRAAAFDRLQAHLALYQARNIPVVLALGRFPATDTDIEPWRQFIRAIVERGRGKVAAYQIGEARAGAAPDVNRYVYLLKVAAVQIRSIDSDVLVVQGAIPASATAWQTQVFAAGTAPYIDGVAIGGPASGDERAFRAGVQQMTAVVEHERPSAMVILGPIDLPANAGAAAARLVDAQVQALGTKIQVIVYEGEPSSLGAALAAAARLTDLIAGDLVTLDERAAGLRIMQGPSDVTATTPHRLLYSLTGLDTFFVYWGLERGTPIEVQISVANATAPTVRDPIAGSAVKPARIDRDADGKRLRLTLSAAAHPLVLDFNYGAADTYTQTSEVQNEALPRVEEIIFRHQQSQAAQDAAVRNYITHVRIEQHFHPSPADPPYNIVTENRLFSDRGGVEWEELSFELNGAKWTANRPPFPLVQPEKVLSLPLDLRLNQDYAYRLDGVEFVNGRAAFVVRFDPVDSKQALYRGTLWIDRRSFVRLKVQAVETKLNGPVVSNDETQVFEQVSEVQGRPAWLVTRLVSKQIFLIAGRSVLVEREIHFSDFALNVPEFEIDRAAARASNRIMYRDTNEGVRYLVKRGETRVVSNQLTTSARAFALGADVDPSFDFPLPIGGLDILDFNFLHRDMQLALLYGGVIALGNVQRANLWGGRFDASVDFFGLALKSNDDVFGPAGKRGAERVNRIPVSTGFNLGYQLTPFQKVSGHYELRYDAYFRDVETGPSFVIPSSTATSGEGAGYEYRRRGYSLTSNIAAYRRTTWTAWGAGEGFDAADRTYSKYDVGFSKDYIFATFHTVHLNGTYFGGRRLDRFSMYQFGLFDATRMHGVPSAVRFADLGMLRGSYSFNLFEQYRFDVFVDHAIGRDSSVADAWRHVTGTGIRLNLRAPRSTILQVDLGKSFLPDAFRGAGAVVLQIMLLKPL